MSFIREFVRDPLTVGAIAPSSSALARLATAAVPRTGSAVVVELGPGNGAFTEAIQRRLAGRGQHIAVEVNPRFAQQLAAHHPAVDVVNADATDLAAVLTQRGLSQADIVQPQRARLAVPRRDRRTGGPRATSIPHQPIRNPNGRPSASP